MAHSLTNIRVSMTIDGVGTIRDDQKPTETIATLTDTFKVEVSNGTGPGDIRERKASFQLTFHNRNRDGMLALLEGARVDATITFGSITIPMKDFFISEVSWRSQPGRMIADVLVLGDDQKMKYNTTFFGVFEPPKHISTDGTPPKNPFAHQIFRKGPDGSMARDHPVAVYQENNRIGWAWTDEVKNDPVWWVDAQYDTDRIIELAMEYDMNPLLSWVAAPLLARGWIEEHKFGFHVARWGGQTPVEIPPAYVEADKSTTYSVEDFPNAYNMMRRSRTKTYYDIGSEVERFHRVETELDLTTDVFSLGNLNVGEKLSLHEMHLMWSMKPRNRWRLNNGTVRLSRWADSSSTARTAAGNLVREIFRTPTPTTTFIPSVTVPLAQTADGLPYELWGIVDGATLTINPTGSPQPRALLQLDLGPGDGQGIGITTWELLDARWNLLTDEWSRL